ncbi:MAG: hypothetical protein ACI9W2_004678, partial [Gammaproteobacteria bacterium]
AANGEDIDDGGIDIDMVLRYHHDKAVITSNAPITMARSRRSKGIRVGRLGFIVSALISCDQLSLGAPGERRKVSVVAFTEH